jgi:UV excision repair protein RAD23
MQTARLCEMGFPQDQVLAALNANSGNEEAALNSLLAGPTPVLAPPPAAAAGAAAGAAPGGAPGQVALGPDGLPLPPPAGPPAGEGPAKPSKPSGLFGKLWGSK